MLPVCPRRHKIHVVTMDVVPMRPSGALGIPASGCNRAAGLARYTEPLFLNRRTRNITVRAIDAAIALLRLHLPAALPARIKILASIGRHRLGSAKAAVGAGDRRMHFYHGASFLAGGRKAGIARCFRELFYRSQPIVERHERDLLLEIDLHVPDARYSPDRRPDRNRAPAMTSTSPFGSFQWKSWDSRCRSLM